MSEVWLVLGAVMLVGVAILLPISIVLGWLSTKEPPDWIRLFHRLAFRARPEVKQIVLRGGVGKSWTVAALTSVSIYPPTPPKVIPISAFLTAETQVTQVERRVA